LAVSARLAMSQAEVKSTSRAIGLPWNEQVFGSALTVICALAWALARSGLAALGQRLEQREVGQHRQQQPAMMIGLRPILSDSVPKTTKNGVPISSDAAIRMLAVALSTFSTLVRKNSA
jgi:hypothetical protein